MGANLEPVRRIWLGSWFGESEFGGQVQAQVYERRLKTESDFKHCKPVEIVDKLKRFQFSVVHRLGPKGAVPRSVLPSDPQELRGGTFFSRKALTRRNLSD